MATGDQSGTWGDTTNTNLGTLLEQAITGVLSVAQGDVANFTPTSLNGASDQARNAVINLTGAMTANRNMVVPNANKLYLVKNSTTGGFSVTVKTSAGTGVLIPPGTARWVYADGTNVVDGLTGNQAANAFLAGYTTTATAAGTTVLTVASTQTQYFTGTSTQTITLPVVSTLVLGQEYEIVNLSTGSLTVNSSGGNLVSTVLAGNTVRVQVIAITGTSAASWNVIAASVPNPLTLSGSTAGYTPLVLTSTEAAAAAGPIQDIYRDSASPAANDILGQLLFNGRDSAANKQEYASIQTVIVDPTSTSEDSTLDFYIQVAGARTLAMSLTGPVGVVADVQLTKSSTNLLLSRYNGTQMFINGINRVVPSGGVTLSASGTASSTLYYIYVFMNSGTMTLEYSTTVPATDATYGHQIKNGDATRSLVGMARTDGGSAWADSATQRFVLSYYNRRSIGSDNAFTSNQTTTSATLVELSTSIRCEFLTWADGSVDAAANFIHSNSAARCLHSFAVGFDGTTPENNGYISTDSAPNANDAWVGAISVAKSGLAVGYHYATLLAATNSATLTVYGAAAGNPRTAMSLNLRG